MNSAGIKKKKKGGTGGAFSIAPVAISPTVSWGDHQAQLPEARFGGFDGPEWVVGDSIQIDEPLPPPDIIDKWSVNSSIRHYTFPNHFRSLSPGMYSTYYRYLNLISKLNSLQAKPGISFP